MFYGDDVQDTRQLFFSSWQKYREKHPLLPLEQQIVDVILVHPEYHGLLEATKNKEQAYFPEMGQTNPFLHMGLHLAIRDQISTNRPEGISTIYQQLVKKFRDSLAVEHLMMEYLAECLWQAQRDNTYPDESNYLQALTQLLN
ncbi:DUF1841 family protein [Legionella hackeliae]|uniref:DUF1841 domain-containing protein n=1 Tax=Legionella hackeliae TaxID=449 RepID=A0A0A8UR41_LEGHA|nr:DUF1841 family protein [Legionella hackeliae]KTD12919.1 hypothetical protein Lhac_1790 [Legionella hackeliae]CEK09229.1 conserved protein of unknown function [Legionella hackeliae]STX49135.1 Domain of uncharacterised function (DUF1841) [Legionella hackeliae]